MLLTCAFVSWGPNHKGLLDGVVQPKTKFEKPVVMWSEGPHELFVYSMNSLNFFNITVYGDTAWSQITLDSVQPMGLKKLMRCGISHKKQII